MDELISTSESNIVIRATKFRWVVLLGIFLQSWLNGFLWISLALVTNYAVSYYNTSEFVLNWVALTFPIVLVILGLPAAAFMDIFGIRSVLFVVTACNLCCGILRIISVNFSGTKDCLVLLVIAQILASIAQPMCLFSPTKVALVWFPDTQRTTATTIASLSNALGVLVGSTFPPYLVHSADDIEKLNKSIFYIALAACLLTLPSMFKAKPSFFPSVAAAAVAVSLQRNRQLTSRLRARLATFFGSTRSVLKNGGYLMLCVNFSIGIAYFTTVSAMFQQMLCTEGYSNEFAGLCGASMIGSGCILAVFVALIVDKTKALLTGIKLCFSFALLGCLGFSVAIYFPGQGPLVLASIVCFGAFGFSMYGLALEMAAECTYPTPEVITTGLMLIVSQIFAVLLILLLQAVAPVLENSPLQTCGPDSHVQDYSIPHQVIVCCLAVWAVVQLFWLDLPYLRRAAESTAINLLPDTELPIDADNLYNYSLLPDSEILEDSAHL